MGSMKQLTVAAAPVSAVSADALSQNRLGQCLRVSVCSMRSSNSRRGGSRTAQSTRS